MPAPPHVGGPGQPTLPVPFPVMGAIKPWHISVLCCLVVTAVLVVGLVVFFIKRSNSR